MSTSSRSATTAYKQAASKSYEGQQKSFSVRIGAEPTEIPLGFQPLGISISGKLIAIAAYFEPAVLLAEVAVSRGALHLRGIRWIRGTMNNDSFVRMFPDVFQPGGANRMQNALIYSPKRFGLIRNGDRRIFFVDLFDDGKWHHGGEALLPENGYPLLHSAVVEGDQLFTTESDGSLEHWVVCTYQGDSPQNMKLVSDKPTTPYRYLGARHADGTLYSVGDVRAKRDLGIFADECRGFSVAGNGIVLLDGGKSGALVTRYGQAYPGPFNGIPGALIYVPPSLL